MKAAAKVFSAGAKIGRGARKLGRTAKGIGRFGGYASKIGRATRSLRKVIKQVSHRSHSLREHAQKFQELRQKGIDGIKRAWEIGRTLGNISFRGSYDPMLCSSDMSK